MQYVRWSRGYCVAFCACGTTRIHRSIKKDVEEVYPFLPWLQCPTYDPDLLSWFLRDWRNHSAWKQYSFHWDEYVIITWTLFTSPSSSAAEKEGRCSATQGNWPWLPRGPRVKCSACYSFHVRWWSEKRGSQGLTCTADRNLHPTIRKASQICWVLPEARQFLKQLSSSEPLTAVENVTVFSNIVRRIEFIPPVPLTQGVGRW